MDESSDLVIEPPITDLATLVAKIQEECFYYQEWEEEPSVLEVIRKAYWHLKGRIGSLQGFFPPFGQLPGGGLARWRDLQEAVTRVTEADQTGFFRALDGLLEWLVVQFPPETPQAPPTLPTESSRTPQVAVGGVETEPQTPIAPLAPLTPTEQLVFEAVSERPRKGRTIARLCGKSYDAVRQILPNLQRYGRVTKVGDGYVRCENVDTHQ